MTPMMDPVKEEQIQPYISRCVVCEAPSEVCGYCVHVVIMPQPIRRIAEGHLVLPLSVPCVWPAEPTHGYILGRVLVEYLQFIPYRCP